MGKNRRKVNAECSFPVAIVSRRFVAVDLIRNNSW
jgi:hypothetical protein